MNSVQDMALPSYDLLWWLTYFIASGKPSIIVYYCQIFLMYSIVCMFSEPFTVPNSGWFIIIITCDLGWMFPVVVRDHILGFRNPRTCPSSFLSLLWFKFSEFFRIHVCVWVYYDPGVFMSHIPFPLIYFKIILS